MMENQLVKKAILKFLQAVRSDFKSLFVTGLLVILPLWVTFLVIKFLIGMLDRAILIFPSQLRPENLLGFHIPGIGILITVFIILFFGFVARNFVGRRLVSWSELLIARIPLIRSVYSAIKQFTYTLMGNNQDFQRAVAVEYPRKGIWTIGFVTNRIPKGHLADRLQEEYLSVFLPTTPNPTSGWLLMLPEADCVRLSISVEDAFKIIVSGGVVLPESLGTADADPST